MALRIGDVAPNFQAKSSIGSLDFHAYLGNHWGILFSHPKDFTPGTQASIDPSLLTAVTVCTTELGYLQRKLPEFEKRGVKLLGLSVDSEGMRLRV